MRIHRIELKNYKKFTDFSLDLDRQFTLIVGDNGVGKTTILDALAIMAGVWLVNPPDTKLNGSRRNIETHEIHLTSIDAGDRSQFVECKPVQIRACGIINGTNFEWMRQIKKGGSRTSNTASKEILEAIEQIFTDISNGDSIRLPIIAYYGAGRAWLPSNKKSPTAKHSSKNVARRWDAFYDCLNERIRITDLQTWFQKEAIAALSRGKLRAGFKAVKIAILRCIPEAKDLWFDADRSEIVFQLQDSLQPLSNLSAGQKMMVCLIADIAIKIVTQNAAFLPEDYPTNSEELPDIFQQTNGLILIDELDVHLHPKWQKRIVNDLKTTFPALQFVCTTHSPFIIQSIDHGQLRSLDDNIGHIEYANKSIEDIAETVQHVETPQQSLKAQELAKATEAYFKVIQDPNFAGSQEFKEVETKYRQASQAFSENPGLTALLKLEAMAKAEEYRNS